MKTAAIVLAAGRSSRMQGPNKLLEMLRGKSLLLSVVQAVCASRAQPVLLVTGHQAEMVAHAVREQPVTLVHNPNFAEGLATSLRAGLAALPQEIDAAVILLGDMPDVTPELVNQLIAALEASPAHHAAVPVFDGEWGNPVVLRRSLFPDLAKLTGDAGARKLLMARREEVLEVPVTERAVVHDIDTPEALASARERGSP